MTDIISVVDGNRVRINYQDQDAQGYSTPDGDLTVTVDNPSVATVFEDTDPNAKAGDWVVERTGGTSPLTVVVTATHPRFAQDALLCVNTIVFNEGEVTGLVSTATVEPQPPH
jgi:hypothetical protein